VDKLTLTILTTQLTGIITRVLFRLAHGKGFEGMKSHAFDLTQDMLDVFQQWITARQANTIELAKVDVLELEQLRAHWRPS
jgi:hypothetical protein